jgi:hypothetical protein
MTCSRHRLSFGIVWLVLGAASGALAQNSAEQPAAAKVVESRSAAAVETLEAGQVRAELLTIGGGKALTAGSGAFAQVKLSTDIAAKKGVNAEIVVEAEQGELVSLGGADIQSEADGKRLRARVEGLRKGRARNMLVEVKLPATGSERTALKVALRAIPHPGKSNDPAPAGEASTTISWSVKDCAGGYYGALQEIRANADLRVGDKWKEAAKADGSLPKGWVFEPREERRSRRRRSEPDITASTKAERAILAEAGRLARAGSDPALSRDGDLGWALGKVSADLDAYLSQPTNPAICTGALGLTDYYTKRLSALAKRGERLQRLAADAKGLAQAKVEAAFAAARALADESAGWSGVTPVGVKAMAVRTDSLTGMAFSLAELVAVPGDVLAKVKDAKAPYDALVLAEEAGIERAGMPDEIRSAVRKAFTAIDGAARLEAILARHMSVQAAFDGRINAIRDAHGKFCVCDS